MQRRTAPFVLFAVCSLALLAMGQENRIVRVGVATMKNSAGRSVPGDLQRDRLVSNLNQQKPDKKTHVALQAVPLDGTSRDEAADQANQKRVDYVVYTTLIQLSLSSDPTIMARTPGTIQTNPNIGVGMPGSSPGSLNQTYQATVEYKLYRADGTAVSGAPFSVQQAISDDAAVSQLMDRIAMRVASEVKKAAPPPPMRE
jgi:hypothetical protein